MTPPTDPASPRPALPVPIWSLRLVRWHLVAAQACLAGAVGWVALRPAGPTLSILHPESLACVHLVTLGTIAMAGIGAFHGAQAMVLRAPRPATWVDWFLFGALLLVATGVASHMALGTYSGVSWSAALLLLALVLRLPRLCGAGLAGSGPLALRLGSAAAWLLFAAAIVAGGLLAEQHAHLLLPTDPRLAIVAHAHLALGGFAGTLVAAVGLRLLPMFVPCAPPAQPFAGAAIALLAAGGATVGVGLFVDPARTVGLWLLWAGGATWLLVMAATLVRRRLPRPAGLPPLLPAHALLATAAVQFAAALALGLGLLLGWLDGRWWSAYGSSLLLAFAGLIGGVGQRLVPLAARLHGGRQDAHRPPAPRLAWWAALCWTPGALLLPVALHHGDTAWVRPAAALLLAATLANLALLLRSRAAPRDLVSSAAR